MADDKNINELLSTLSEEEIIKYQNSISKIPDSVLENRLKQLAEEMNEIQKRLDNNHGKNPKSRVYEYVQKHKLKPVKFSHTFNELTRTFNSCAVFDNKVFDGVGPSKKTAEVEISLKILDYIDTHFNIKQYESPSTYDKLIYIDLENFTSMPLDILPNYSTYKIVGYLAFNHALVDKLDYIKRFMEIKLVDCMDKDAVDIQMTIDIARFKYAYTTGAIKKVYLLTGDHFGKTVEKLVEYCECITDYKYLMNHKNHLLE